MGRPGLGGGASAPGSSGTALTQAERGASLELPQVVVSLKPGRDQEAVACEANLDAAFAKVRNLTWTLLSNAFWGENPSGKWTLKLRDTVARDTGTLVSYTAMARMGYLVNDSSAELLDYP